MQASYDERFVRDMGCTERDWLGWLPGAVGGNPWELGAQSATVQIGTGVLRLHWHQLPPRVIALLRMPRLQVTFEFTGLDAAQRQAFMRHFDLHTQRGGG